LKPAPGEPPRQTAAAKPAAAPEQTPAQKAAAAADTSKE